MKLLLIIITLLIGLCATARSADYDLHIDSEDSLVLEYTGSAAWSHFTDMVVDGDLLYATMAFGLKILDLSDPENPVQVCQVYMQGSFTWSLAFQKPYLYVRTVDGLTVFDVTQPAAPELVGQLDNECYEGVMTVAGDYAYLSCGKRLVTVDVSNPASPLAVDEMSFPRGGSQGAIYVADTFLYLAIESFYIVDIADPAHPELVSTVAFPDLYCAKDLAVVDTLVFIANHLCGEPASNSLLTVINVADPQSPRVVASRVIYGGVYHLVPHANYIFASCGISGIVAFDVTDPLSPLVAGCYSGPRISGPIAVHENHLIVSDDMTAWSEYPYRNCGSDSTSWADSLTRPGDMQVIDISDPSSLNLLGTLPTGGLHQYLAVSESRAFISDKSADVLVLEGSHPDTVIMVGRQQLPQQSGKVCISRDYLYIPLGPLGLHIMDVSNPDSLVTVSEIATSGSAGAVDIQGNYAYVTGSLQRLEIIDITDPTAPQIVGSAPLQGKYNMEVAAHGNHAYVAESDRMEIIDITDPTEPIPVGTFVGSYINNVAVFDTIAIAASPASFCVVNVADPENPIQVSEWGVAEMRDIAIDGDHLYAASAEAGVLVFDLSSPSDIRLVSQIRTPTSALSIAVDSGYLWIADRFGVTRYKTPGHNGNGHNLPTSFTLHQNHPNPFNHSTTITFNLNSSAHVTLEVLNILGQCVETLLDQMMPGGAVSAGWDATDYASGVYLYRLTVGDSQQTRKMLLLK